MSNLYILCGVPGSGKSYFASHSLGRMPNMRYVSRDEIRFKYISDTDNYFSKEKIVYNDFINIIQKNLNDGFNVIADATHLNEKSRNKLLDRLNLTGVKICCINFNTPLQECINRNSKRNGRQRVPDENLLSMYECYSPATFKEKYKYAKIATINEEGRLIWST